jgi:hypothetical protein
VNWPGRGGRLLRRTSLLLSLVCLLTGRASAQEEIPLEYRVKAALLVKFVGQIEWPAGAFADEKTPVTIGILGADPFGPALEAVVQNANVNGRPLAIRRSAEAGELTGCHMVFMGGDDLPKLARALERFKEQPVVTVGERDGFTRFGGTILFFLQDNRLSFEVNLAAADRANVKVSSRLLRLDKVRITRDGKEVRP